MAQKKFGYSGSVWREKHKHRNKLGLKLALLITAGALVWPLLHSHSAAPVTVIAAQRKDIPVLVNATGNVQAANSVVVHPQVAGQITEILFKEGQQVKKGDVLAHLDPSLYRAQLAKAMADKEQDVTQAQALRDQLKPHMGVKNPSPQARTMANALHQYEAAIQSDNAAIQQAQALLNYTTIVAPIDGRVGIKRVDAGNIIQPTDAAGLVEITQMNPVSIVFSLSEQNVPAITAAMADNKPIPVTAHDLTTGAALDQGALQIVDNQVNPATGAVIFKANFDNNNHRLWPGALVNVQLNMGTMAGATVVPVASLIRHGQQQYVYKVDAAKHTVALHPVTVATTQGNEAVIAEGLKPGDQLAMDASTKMADVNLLANIVPAR